MPKTPSKMHMYDMLKIHTIVFEIDGCNDLISAFKALLPPDR